ncbi:MAG: hypothetical protein LRY55_08420 [Leadbetterella sp.]|nr:hypothetical protein [Leadbetterella sp.]
MYINSTFQNFIYYLHMMRIITKGALREFWERYPDSVENIKKALSPVKTEEQYRYYLSVTDDLIDCEENSEEEELLELVSILVEDYESTHYPIEAVRQKASEPGLKRKDLAPLLISEASAVFRKS